MDAGESLTYLFEDNNWVSKLVIGALLSLIPIIGTIFLLGYMVQVVDNVRHSHARPLPPWRDFGQLFSDGLKLGLGFLVYYLPAIFITICSIIPIIGAAIWSENAAAPPSDAFEFGLFSYALGLQCLYFIVYLAPLLIFPVALIRYTETKEITAVLKIQDLFAMIRQDIGNYLLLLLVSFGVTWFLAPLGFFLCFVGVLLTQWWAYLIVAHLSGQYFEKVSGAHPEIIM